VDYEQLVVVMRTLALEAGAKIMEIYGADDFEVMTKSDDSPVTVADEAADKIISDGLRAAFPGTMLVTEEQAATHSTTGSTFLIVDPLDGTKEFINRRGDFTQYCAGRKWRAHTRHRLRACKRSHVLYASRRPIGGRAWALWAGHGQRYADQGGKQ